MLIDVQHCEDLHRWNALAERTFGPIDVGSRSRCFQGGMSVCDWEGVRLVEVQSTPAQVVGGASGRPGWFLLFNRGGLCNLRQQGERTSISRGEMTLLRADDAYDIWFDEPNRMQVVSLPMIDLPAGLTRCVLQRFGAVQASVVGALLDRLRAMAEAGRKPEQVAVLRLLADLVLMAADEPGGPPTHRLLNRHQQRLARLQDVVARRLEEPELGAERVAHELGVSARTLQKLLAGQGTTMGAYLNEQRLRRAAELLRARSDRVADIALEVGFSDISHFCRAFKRRFGCTAREWREGR